MTDDSLREETLRRRREDELECLALEDEREEEGGECSRLRPKSGSTLTILGWLE